MPARARVLTVGAGKDYATPAAAAAAAAAGDEVRIVPGSYYDCAVWHADNLLIAGSGPDTVLTDSACQGKASFVITGAHVTVRDLTFARIRVPDGNGAGIRAEGRDLHIERVRFINDQVGLLAAGIAGGTIAFRNCSFTDVGVADARRTIAAIMASDSVDRLEIHGTTFSDDRAGIAIHSDAEETVITDSRIDAARLPGGPTVQVSGGLVMEGTQVQAGPVRGARLAAVQALPARSGAPPLVLRRDRLEGAGILLLNWSGRTAMLEGNEVGPHGIETTADGRWSYWARSNARATYSALHTLAGHAYRAARATLQRIVP